jgi:hypothetical protein
MNVIIPERRTSFDNAYTNCYTRILPNNTTEYYHKEFYNPDFTRKVDDDEVLENIQKEILLLMIDDYFKGYIL